MWLHPNTSETSEVQCFWSQTLGDRALVMVKKRHVKTERTDYFRNPASFAQTNSGTKQNHVLPSMNLRAAIRYRILVKRQSPCGSAQSSLQCIPVSHSTNKSLWTTETSSENKEERERETKSWLKPPVSI